jgi:arylsulfate sulfotransferase
MPRDSTDFGKSHPGGSMKTIFWALMTIAGGQAAMSVRLVPGLPSPQPVGTVIGLMPRVEVSGPGIYTYRYSVSTGNGPFHVVRDFSQAPNFAWMPEMFEHAARIRVTVRNSTTKETSEGELPFEIISRVNGSRAVVTPTAHPLVALFSSPPCPQGAEFRAAFRKKGDEVTAHTRSEQCRGTASHNVYVAGMRADSDYEMRAEFVNGDSIKPDVWIPFHTGLSDGQFPPVATQAHRASGRSAAEALVVRSMVDPWRATATDLDGNVVWYLSAPGSFLTRVLPGGRFLVHAEGANSANTMKRWQLLRELDLASNTIRETNISRVAEQLESRGIKSDCKTGGKECVSGFHHEAIRLPNGHTMVLAGLERLYPAGTQGSKEPVDILGDLILDLDEDFQLTWAWNSFDHLDLKRAALGNEKCKAGPGDDGCTPVFLASEANGWLHSNALYYMPHTGDLLLSIPEQDWVIKIDYKNGNGTGKVLWRLGQDGDFIAKSNDRYPWFSYQHDVGFDPESGLLVLFDDGHRRKIKDPKANNRGQTWQIDEANRTATLIMNADLGVYAVAVGSAQPLSDGNYSFESGFISPGPAGLGTMYCRTTETSPTGEIVYAQQVEGALTYRSFRLPDMYSAPRK